MLNCFLKSKIHDAIVTEVNLNYHGSITLGQKLSKAADMLTYEKVDIYNITNGERFSTYVLKGSPDGTEICLNGAAARKVAAGDRVIICSFVSVDLSKESPPEPVVIMPVHPDNSVA